MKHSRFMNEFVFVRFCRLCSAATSNDSSRREQLVRVRDEVTHHVAHASGDTRFPGHKRNRFDRFCRLCSAAAPNDSSLAAIAVVDPHHLASLTPAWNPILHGATSMVTLDHVLLLDHQLPESPLRAASCARVESQYIAAMASPWYPRQSRLSSKRLAPVA